MSLTIDSNDVLAIANEYQRVPGKKEGVLNIQGFMRAITHVKREKREATILDLRGFVFAITKCKLGEASKESVIRLCKDIQNWDQFKDFDQETRVNFISKTLNFQGLHPWKFALQVGESFRSLSRYWSTLLNEKVRSEGVTFISNQIYILETVVKSEDDFKKVMGEAKAELIKNKSRWGARFYNEINGALEGLEKDKEAWLKKTTGRIEEEKTSLTIDLPEVEERELPLDDSTRKEKTTLAILAAEVDKRELTLNDYFTGKGVDRIKDKKTLLEIKVGTKNSPETKAAFLLALLNTVWGGYKNLDANYRLLVQNSIFVEIEKLKGSLSPSRYAALDGARKGGATLHGAV